MATPAEGADYDEGDGQEDTATMLVTMDEMAKSTLRRVSTTSIIGRDRKASVASSSGRESTSLEGIRRTSIRRISTALSMSEAEIAQATSPTKINKSIQRKISLHQEQGVKLRDLVLLPTISTESVVDTLQQRYAEDLIYTYIGNVVVSVNPYKQLKIYDQSFIDAYRGSNMFDLNQQPHIFALTDAAYSDMQFRRRSQVVVISGESGAGKTEASKKIMHYIAAVSGGGQAGSAIKEKLLTTNPVLEAFGNAKTIRNDNSSRFGKYMNIDFDYHGYPVGGTITTYLLEKARVTQQSADERNFHVFYQLCASGELKRLGLPSDPNQYTYLNQGSTSHVKGIVDKNGWSQVKSSLGLLGFGTEIVLEMEKILGAVLTLGQPDILELGLSRLRKSRELETTAELLGTTRERLYTAITNHTIVAMGEMVTSPLDEAQASYARHTLAKAIYERLFRFIAGKMNEHIRTSLDADSTRCIGVLDIYGFEIFNENSFEQFCINYCNEKLQQLFIEVTLKSEQQNYIEEGLSWVAIPYFDNKAICDLIEKRPKGILALLDEECVRPGDKSDDVFLLKLNGVLSDNEYFESRMVGGFTHLSHEVFVLTHYAGQVEYTVTGFLDKNIDTLFRDLSRGMFESKSSLLRDMFPEGDSSTWTSAQRRPKTAGAAFKSSMASMIELLTLMNPSYIRCIKPNDKKKPGQFDDLPVTHQVCYLGLVENIRVRRVGYCFRMAQDAFFMRFRVVCTATYPHWKGSVEEGIAKILPDFTDSDKQFEFGKTMVFIKEPKTVFALETARDLKMSTVSRQIQRFWRRWHVKRVIGPYWKAVSEAFRNVARDGNFGKYFKWPSNVPPKLRQADAYLKRIHNNWWAKRKIGALSEDEQKNMRLVIMACRCLSSEFAPNSDETDTVVHAAAAGTALLRKSFDLTRAFKGVYGIDQVSTRSRSEKAVAWCSDRQVLFSAPMMKLNRKGKLDSRNLLCSERNIVKVDDAFKVNSKRQIPFELLKDVTISPHSDSVLVLHSREAGQDTVACLEFNGENLVPEFVARLQEAYMAHRGKPLPIIVSAESSIEYNNSGKVSQARALTFIPRPAEAGAAESATCMLTANSVFYRPAAK